MPKLSSWDGSLAQHDQPSKNMTLSEKVHPGMAQNYALPNSSSTPHQPMGFDRGAFGSLPVWLGLASSSWGLPTNQQTEAINR